MSLSFAEPLWLLGLLCIPLAVVLLERRSLPALTYASLPLVSGLPGVRSGLRRERGLLVLVAVAMLFVAAAQPRTPDYTTRLPGSGVALAIVLDVSGSMAEPITVGGSSRLDAARSAITQLLLGESTEATSGRSEDQVALIVFSALPRTLTPLTFNHRVSVQLLEAQKPRSGPDSGTNIGDAIAEAVNRLQRSDAARKVIILVSDGEHNLPGDGQSGPVPPLQAGRLAESQSIVIHAIDCGGVGTTPELEKQRADGLRVLTEMTKMTTGRCEKATSEAELKRIIQELDQLERSTALSFRYRRYQYWYREVAYLALGIVTVAVLFLLSQRPMRPGL